MTALAYCTITGKITDFTVGAAGAPPTSTAVVGQVKIKCDAHAPGKQPVLMLPTTDDAKVVDPFVVALAADGTFSVKVPATGQTGVTVPSDFTYTAEFTISDANGRSIRIPSLTFEAPAGTLDLSDVPPVLPSAGTIVGVSANQVAAMLTGLAQADLSNVTPATGRSALGLGSASTHPATDFATTAQLGTLVPTQTTAPDHTKTSGWFDSSTSPAVFKQWNGTAWAAFAGGSGGVTVTDNADGTLTITSGGSSTVVDNNDGTLTFT